MHACRTLPMTRVSRPLPTSLWWIAVLVLFAVRLAHLGGPLDDPHSWRQCDTVWYTRAFVRGGIDLLHPKVSWMGGHGTLILEFPLPEAISALLGRAFGMSDVWDRLVALAFFVLATIYFHRIARAVAGPGAARLATLAWLALPLSQFYSRAAHVDFAAVAFAHGFLWHAMQAMRRGSPAHAVASGVCGALAAMIKAPDLLPLLAPLAVAWAAVPGLASAALAAASLAITGGAFLAWHRHVNAVNAAAPDWFFLPGYYKEVNPWWWYVGSWSQRLERAAWTKLAHRLLFDVATPVGAVLSPVALAWRRPCDADAEPAAASMPWPAATAATGRFARTGPVPGAVAFTIAWLAGAMAHLLVFFPLAVIHNYYEIPFVAPVALAVGLGLDVLMRRRAAGVIALLLFIAGSFVTIQTLGYYRIDWLRVEGGTAIAARTAAADLVIAVDHGSGYSDPRLLERADRAGWSLASSDVTPDRVRRLAGLGARWMAVVTSPEHVQRGEVGLPGWLAPARVGTVTLVHAGQPVGTLDLYDLRRMPPA